MEQDNTPALMEHPDGPLSTVHPSPELAGSVSLRVRPVAAPVPAAAELITLMLYPIGSPALTVLLSAVLLTCNDGQSTIVEAVASCDD
jgi:hypothetical protein